MKLLARCPSLLVCLFACTIVGISMPIACVPPSTNGPMGDDDEDMNDDMNDDDDDGMNDVFVPGLPLADYTTDNFAGPANCAPCHGGLTDANENDVSIDTDWRATMMANAAKDPFFLAMVRSEVDRAPDAIATVVEDTCAKCHLPIARTQAVADGTESRMFEDGFLNSSNALHEPAMDGVSCTLCHQIQDGFLADSEASFSGGYEIDTDAEAPDRTIFGPFEGPQSPNVMASAVGFTPEYAPHILESGLCATCHTLFTPTLSAAGEIVGEFPEQVPYLEWIASDYATGGPVTQTCQDCHMPTAEGAVTISQVPVGLMARQPFYQHLFLSGNVFMLRMMRDNIEELGTTASSDDFNRAIALGETFLQNETATLTIADASVANDTLSIDVDVTNLAGHKFPTSFPSRRAWIHLTVTDAGGQTVFESGKWRADGSIVGNDADDDRATFEPHYDMITSGDQVQIYEVIMANTDGAATYTLLRANRCVKNNRLLPDGFDKAGADADVAVIGAASGDANFVAGSDRISYEIDLAGASGPFDVSVEFLFQPVAFPFAQDLGEEDAELVERFSEFYETADKTPSVVATAETTVQ